MKFSCQLATSQSDRGKCEVLVNLVMASLEPHQQSSTAQEGDRPSQDDPFQMIAENDASSQIHHQPNRTFGADWRDRNSASTSVGNSDCVERDGDSIVPAHSRESADHESGGDSGRSLSPEVLGIRRRDGDKAFRRLLESQTSDEEELHPSKSMRNEIRVTTMPETPHSNRRVIIVDDDDDEF